VIGIDFTPEMTDKAKQNASKLGYSNVEFHTETLRKMPVPDQVADVVISNCVLNLLPSKEKIFHEIFRVLKREDFLYFDVVLNVNYLLI
jgi:ubiquinone/menaquinone biosynthesis C-methylase UbiE